MDNAEQSCEVVYLGMSVIKEGPDGKKTVSQPSSLRPPVELQEGWPVLCWRAQPEAAGTARSGAQHPAVNNDEPAVSASIGDDKVLINDIDKEQVEGI